MLLGRGAAPTNRSVPAKQATKMLYSLYNLGLVFTAIISSTFITIFDRHRNAYDVQDYCCHGEGNLFHLVLLLGETVA